MICLPSAVGYTKSLVKKQNYLQKLCNGFRHGIQVHLFGCSRLLKASRTENIKVSLP